MLKQFWRWLWPVETAEDRRGPIHPHDWSPWSVSDELGEQFFGGHYRIQRRRCGTCGISQEMALEGSMYVPCTKVEQ